MTDPRVVSQECERIAYNLREGLRDERTIQTACAVLSDAARLLAEPPAPALEGARTPSEVNILDDVLSELREPLTLADARKLRDRLTLRANDLHRAAASPVHPLPHIAKDAPAEGEPFVCEHGTWPRPHVIRCQACWSAALSRSREASPRDWPEDFAHENGQYECRCVECGNTFIGHKRRVICKTCASASGEIPAALETILGDREAFIAACRVGNAALVAGHGTMHDKFRAGGAAKLSALAILLKQLPPAGNEGERP